MFCFGVIFIIKPYKTYQKILVLILPFASLFLCYLICAFVFKYISLPPCYIHHFTGLYCPGCGATRAVYALVHGDILLSLRQNAFLAVGIVIVLILYIQFVLRAFGKKINTFINMQGFIWIMFALLIVYTILRNIFPALAPVEITY